MNQIIIQVSKYIILILMAAYTFQCFAVFRFANEYDRKGIYFRQIYFMVLIHFFGFLSLYSYYGELKYFRAYLIQQLGIILVIALYKFIYPAANQLIINNMCVLLTIGFIILTRLSYAKAMKQFVIAIGSVAITLIVPFLISRITFFEKFKWIYVGVGIGSLALVLMFSTVTYGSKLNITIASYTFQPSEYVKIIFVFAIASILAVSQNIKDVLISAVIAGIHILLLVASKDLGSAVIYFAVYLCMLFVATRSYFYFIFGLLSGAAASVIGYKLFAHVRVRILAFRDPLGTIDDAGYQIAQSLFAIGTGGWLGMGISQGAPNTIPVVAADFVFAAICEEFGVVFGMLLILVCASNFIMFMNIAMRFKDRFYKLVAVGLSVSYGFQVFLTIGGVTKFIPLTGVTLPLVSYGGTSVAVTCCVFAVIQGMYISRDRDVKNRRSSSKVENRRINEFYEVPLDGTDDEVMDMAANDKKESIGNGLTSEIVVKIKRRKKNSDVSMDTMMMDKVLSKVVNDSMEMSIEPELESIDINDID